MATFRDYIRRLASIPWMDAPVGGSWFKGLALFADTHLQGMRDAVRTRFIDVSPDDALPYDGADSNMERYPPDTNETYRERIKNRWVTWPTAGTEGLPGEDGQPGGIEGELLRFGVVAEVIEPWEWGDRWHEPYFSHFWLLVTQHPYTLLAPHRYDDGTTYDSGAVYDAGIDIVVANSLRRLIRKFKPGHVICREIVFLPPITPTPFLYDTGVPWDDGWVWSADDVQTIAIAGS